MSEPAVIALDAMGGDAGPESVVPAAVQMLAKHEDLRIILVGDQARLEQQLGVEHARFGDRLALQHASQQVEMTDPPSLALRSKKDSSMRVAINLVKSCLSFCFRASARLAVHERTCGHSAGCDGR